jgi:hypothetical protein
MLQVFQIREPAGRLLVRNKIVERYQVDGNTEERTLDTFLPRICEFDSCDGCQYIDANGSHADLVDDVA